MAVWQSVREAAVKRMAHSALPLLHAEPHGLIELRKRLRGNDDGDAVLASHLPHDRAQLQLSFEQALLSLCKTSACSWRLYMTLIGCLQGYNGTNGLNGINGTSRIQPRDPFEGPGMV